MDRLDLLPCPLCGSNNVQIRGTYYCYVVCLDCECSTGLCRSKEDATERWNKRYYPKEVSN